MSDEWFMQVLSPLTKVLLGSLLVVVVVVSTLDVSRVEPGLYSALFLWCRVSQMTPTNQSPTPGEEEGRVGKPKSPKTPPSMTKAMTLCEISVDLG